MNLRPLDRVLGGLGSRLTALNEPREPLAMPLPVQVLGAVGAALKKNRRLFSGLMWGLGCDVVKHESRLEFATRILEWVGTLWDLVRGLRFRLRASGC